MNLYVKQLDFGFLRVKYSLYLPFCTTCQCIIPFGLRTMFPDPAYVHKLVVLNKQNCADLQRYRIPPRSEQKNIIKHPVFICLQRLFALFLFPFSYFIILPTYNPYLTTYFGRFVSLYGHDVDVYLLHSLFLCMVGKYYFPCIYEAKKTKRK